MSHYRRSLDLIRNVKKVDDRILTKSGFMLGLGEESVDVIRTMEDLRGAKCDILTIGQYLAPSKLHHPVVEYLHPGIFDRYRQVGLELGFTHVSSGPLVRSSYHADQMVKL
jgi:lipoic acid synthetase